MSNPLRPCGGPFTSSSSIIFPSNPARNPQEEEDIDALMERYAQEFELMEKHGDLPDDLKGATWERTAEELARSNAVYGELNIQYDPEAKNRSVRIQSKDRFRLLAFIEAQRKKAAQQGSSQQGLGRSTVAKNRVGGF